MKNKLTKLALALGTVASVAAPIAAVVSCGSSDADSNPTVLSIVAEKSWAPAMNKIIAKFKTDNADELKKQGIKDIKIVEAGAFEMADRLSTKGYKDSGVSDIVLLPGDRVTAMMEQGYIKPITETTLADFAKKEIAPDATFLDGAIAAAAPGLETQGTASTDDDEVYAVPENIEAMVGWAAGTSYPGNPKSLTVISDLWKANGFFNTDTVNLKDIVDTSGDRAKYNSDLGSTGGTKAFLEAGFKKMISGTDYSGDMLNSSADVAAPKVQQHWAGKAGTVIIGGPWEKDALKEVAGGSKASTTYKTAVDAYRAEQTRVAKHNSVKDIKDEDKIKMDKDIVKAYDDIKDKLGGTVSAGTPTDYNQWAGGWNFVLNARMDDKKQTVAEKLIGELLNKDNAQAVYDGMDKMSPTQQGKDVIDAGTTGDIDVIYNTASNLKARPVAAEFGVVWGAYADTIQGLTTDIEEYSNSKDAAKLTALATSFADNFKSAIETALNKA